MLPGVPSTRFDQGQEEAREAPEAENGGGGGRPQPGAVDEHFSRKPCRPSHGPASRPSLPASPPPSLVGALTTLVQRGCAMSKCWCPTPLLVHKLVLGAGEVAAGCSATGALHPAVHADICRGDVLGGRAVISGRLTAAREVGG